MKKLFSVIFIVLIACAAYASEYTDNYRFEIPSISVRNWQPIISNDIISIDRIVYRISQDVVDMKANRVSTDAVLTALTSDIATITALTSDIISSDVFVPSTLAASPDVVAGRPQIYWCPTSSRFAVYTGTEYRQIDLVE